MLLKKEDWLGIGVVVFIILLVGAFFAFAPQAPEITYKPVEVTGSDLVVIAPAKDQKDFVKVSATLVKPGFVVIHQAIGEAPGPIISSSPYLKAGTYIDYQIPTTLSAENDYFALLFADDGDGVYEAGVDLPVMSNGAVIKRGFSLPL